MEEEEFCIFFGYGAPILGSVITSSTGSGVGVIHNMKLIKKKATDHVTYGPCHVVFKKEFVTNS